MNARQQYEKFLKDVEEIPADELATMMPEEISIRKNVMTFCKAMMNSNTGFFLIYESEPLFTMSQYQKLVWDENGESTDVGNEFSSHFISQICFSIYLYLKKNLESAGVDNPTCDDIIDFFLGNAYIGAEFIKDTQTSD